MCDQFSLVARVGHIQRRGIGGSSLNGCGVGGGGVLLVVAVGHGPSTGLSGGGGGLLGALLLHEGGHAVTGTDRRWLVGGPGLISRPRLEVRLGRLGPLLHLVELLVVLDVHHDMTAVGRKVGVDGGVARVG